MKAQCTRRPLRRLRKTPLIHLIFPVRTFTKPVRSMEH